MNPQSVTYSLELQDYRAMIAYLSAAAVARSKRKARLFALVGALPLMLIAMHYVESFDSFCLGAFGVAALVLINIKITALGTRKRLELAPGGSILGERQLTLTPQGVELRSRHAEGVTRWAGIIAIDETAGHVFFRTDTLAAYTVPKRAFEHELSLRQFVGLAGDLRSGALRVL